MIYEANTRRWAPGDVVIHDMDAKRAAMLTVVVGYTRSGDVRTVYREPALRAQWRGRPIVNRLAVLHDPARFGIAVEG